jgi:hypothetical protein
MNTNRIKLLSILLSAVVLVTSCNKDDETPLSADDAQVAMAAVDTELANELEDLSQAKGFTALEALAGLSGAGDPFPLGRTKEARKNPASHVRKAVVSLDRMIEGPTQGDQIAGDEPFNYSQNKGVYEWNPSIADFEKTGSSDIIEIRFPTEGSNTNNAVFRLTNYAEEATPDGDEAYSPTIIEATLDVDNVKEASLSVDVEYVGDGTDEPKFADISYFVNPYTIDVDLDDRQTSTTTFSQYLSKGSDKLIGWSLTATYQGLKPEKNISKLVGTFQLGSVVFTIEVNAPTDLNQVDDYNDLIKISITVDGKSAGNVVWVSDSASPEPVPYVEYSDGSKEPLAGIFESLAQSLEELDLI